MKKPCALVLSGGGALGAAHIGLWESLVAKNYFFDFLVGTSAGAIIAALIAIGKTPQETENLLHETSIFKYLFDFSSVGIGLVQGKKMGKLFNEIFKKIEFKDLKIPLFIGATNFKNGNRLMINKGRISDAICASVAVPVLFEPFFHPLYKTWLVDGGLSQNFPLDTAIELYSGTKIFGSDVAGSFPSDISFKNNSLLAKPKLLKDMIQRSFRIIFKNQQNNFLSDPRVTIYRPDLSQYSSFDITKISEIMAAGKKMA